VNRDYAGQRIQGGRDYQEDDFGFDATRPEEFLMVLADGMGGHEGGAYASGLAVQSFIGYYRATEEGDVAARLKTALAQTNEEIAKEIEVNAGLDGMGCTLVAVIISADYRMQWISVGDSPLWLYRRGHLDRCNADHSMKPVLENQVEKGLLTEVEALSHPDRNLLRSAMTGYKIEFVDAAEEPLELFPNDRLLLASDGLLTLSDREIAGILARPRTADAITADLLNAVKQKHRPAQDNATAMTIIVPGPEEATKRRSWWR
jgi:serine/threonine protein phosphatase PrpC